MLPTEIQWVPRRRKRNSVPFYIGALRVHMCLKFHSISQTSWTSGLFYFATHVALSNSELRIWNVIIVKNSVITYSRELDLIALDSFWRLLDKLHISVDVFITFSTITAKCHSVLVCSTFVVSLYRASEATILLFSFISFSCMGESWFYLFFFFEVICLQFKFWQSQKLLIQNQSDACCFIMKACFIGRQCKESGSGRSVRSPREQQRYTETKRSHRWGQRKKCLLWGWKQWSGGCLECL